MGNEVNVLEQILSQIPTEILVSTLITTMIACIFDAFFGFKFLRPLVIISAIYTGFDIGSVELGMLVADVGGAGEILPLVLGIVCAILFGLLALKVYKIAVYIMGGCFGIIFGLCVPMVVFSLFDLSAVGLIVGIILAIVLVVPAAKLFYNKLYKPLYILTSSIGGMMAAAMCLAMIFTFDIALIGLAMLIGFVLGILAAIYQFKLNRDVTLADRIESK
ncbi:MAG: hypothetical protein IJW02_00955 [Clostridia bacterium]|nr:hypothetical protein [Clostridia bacterium]